MKIRGLILAFLLTPGLPSFGQQQSSPPALSPDHLAATSNALQASIPDLTPGPDGKLSQEQMRELFRVVADKDMENDKRQRDYTYIDREVQNKLDGKGKPSPRK